ncbi:hypothetical protein F5984_16755 [Rudanella paleaurantiibacter]|uniref:HmuY family protein n=1 Tax=Rudanella paleaurantiibacter TaxID=2614655 RepID=A0A7J5TXD1_9BACT|nr:HmuY family protein [Rudanella paleaurantiibacter]KAB7729280.1 hypothetical protein F5984_16755 [Rudanella paleaurantiibacter]
MQPVKIAFLTTLTLLSVFGCNQEEPTSVAPVKATTIRNLAADPAQINPQTGQPVGATNKFTLFSLKDGVTVANSDSATNKWDIGFRATTLIINGGSIRSGRGGAFIHTGTFDELKTIPAGTTFATDESPAQLAIPTGSGKGWYNYANTLITPIPGRVLLIRTGDGNYAKVEILSYYKDAPATPTATSEGRYYTFRYVYQPDGSQNLN